MIIGRENEIAILNEKLVSKKSEFVALYGRRRVGKTFLIRNLFEGKFTFRLTGLSKATLSEQLINFNTALKDQYPKNRFITSTNWLEAFQQIGKVIEKSKQKKKIIFIDELPWFDTANSKFVKALEHFWNSYASARKDILLIVISFLQKNLQAYARFGWLRQAFQRVFFWEYLIFFLGFQIIKHL
jgi:AAA+ ATPase superfamily predicted ATPase